MAEVSAFSAGLTAVRTLALENCAVVLMLRPTVIIVMEEEVRLAE